VLLAPLYPGSRGTRRLTLTPRNLLPLLVGGRVPPPARAAGPGWLDLPEPGRSRLAADLAPDDAATVWDLAWGRRALPRAAGVPALVIAGEHDPLLPPDAAASLARAAGAELRVLAGAGHWPFAGPSWQATVALVHRWLVQRLGAPLLELYAEAMAERGTDDEGVE
jgi:pimeloyl-ACP methyl ester carboxylesterase